MKKIILILIISLTNLIYAQTFRVGHDIHDYYALNKGQGRIFSGTATPSSYVTNMEAYLNNSENWIMESYINMYKATHDKKYIDKFILHSKRAQKIGGVIEDSVFNKWYIGLILGPNYTFPTYGSGKKGIGINYSTGLSFSFKMAKKINLISELGYSTHGYPLTNISPGNLSGSYKFRAFNTNVSGAFYLNKTISIGGGIQLNVLNYSLYEAGLVSGNVFDKNSKYWLWLFKINKKIIQKEHISFETEIRYNHNIGLLSKVVYDKFHDPIQIYDTPRYIELLFIINYKLKK